MKSISVYNITTGGYLILEECVVRQMSAIEYSDFMLIFRELLNLRKAI